MPQTDGYRYLRSNIWLLRVVTMWPLPHGPLYLVLRPVTYALATIALLFWMGLILQSFSVIHEAELLVGSVGLVCGYFVSMFKMCCLLRNRKQLQQLADSLSTCLELGAAVTHVAGGEFLRVTRSAFTRGKTITTCWMLGIMYVATYFALIPLTQSGTLMEAPDNATRITSRRPAYLPFGEWPAISSMYELTYAIQASGGIIHGWVHAACDTFFIFFVTFMCGQFEFLLVSLGSAGAPRESESERGTGNECEKHEDERYTDLSNCIRYHQMLLSTVTDFNSIYSPIMLIQFFNTLITLCTFAFHATMMKADNAKMVSMLGFFIATVLEQYLFCRVGSRLNELSEQVADAGYVSDWINKSKAWKKSLEILIMRAQAPLKLTGGPFYVITYETFLAHTQLAFSYFTVLRGMHEKEE